MLLRQNILLVTKIHQPEVPLRGACADVRRNHDGWFAERTSHFRNVLFFCWLFLGCVQAGLLSLMQALHLFVLSLLISLVLAAGR
jgi:hypothetical protein